MATGRQSRRPHDPELLDLRTDLWGVGATAWACYTGIDLNKRADVLRDGDEGNVFGLQRVSDVRLHCPPALEEVIMGMLFIDPARRPGGSSEVLTQLDTIAGGFGLDSQMVASTRRDRADPREIRSVIESLVDPLWASICRSPGFERYFVKFEDGEQISRSGDQTHHTFLLLRGEVEVERDGEVVAIESRRDLPLRRLDLHGRPRAGDLARPGRRLGLHLQRGRARAARDLQSIGGRAHDPHPGESDRRGPPRHTVERSPPGAPRLRATRSGRVRWAAEHGGLPTWKRRPGCSAGRP